MTDYAEKDYLLTPLARLLRAIERRLLGWLKPNAPTDPRSIAQIMDAIGARY